MYVGCRTRRVRLPGELADGVMVSPRNDKWSLGVQDGKLDRANGVSRRKAGVDDAQVRLRNLLLDHEEAQDWDDIEQGEYIAGFRHGYLKGGNL